MASGTPIVRQISWVASIPQFLLLGLLVFTCYILRMSEPVLWGAGIYFLLSFLLRYTVTREHRTGIRYVKKEDYDTAIHHFRNSYEFFSKHNWVDKYRCLTLLSSSRITYKEMALVNIAFCYGQLGDGDNSRKYYEKALAEFPSSQMAKTALNLLNSVSRKESGS